MPASKLAVSSSLAGAAVQADKMAEEVKKYRFETVTTKEGLKFSIPSDMPIDRKDGLVTPIPFDEYLYIKFKQIEERIASVEKRIDKFEKRTDVFEKKILDRLDVMEKNLTAKPEPAPETSAA